MDARVKALQDGERRVTLRASDVLLALMAKLHLVVARIDGSLRLLTSRALVALGTGELGFGCARLPGDQKNGPKRVRNVKSKKKKKKNLSKII